MIQTENESILDFVPGDDMLTTEKLIALQYKDAIKEKTNADN